MADVKTTTGLRDRVIAAMNHLESEKVPVQLEFESLEMEIEMLRHFGVGDLGEIGLRCIYHGKPVEPVSDISDGVYRDIYGSTWRTGHVKHVVHPALSEPSLDSYSFPDYNNPGLHPGLTDVKTNAQGKFVLWNVLRYGLFERAWSITGMEDLLAYMYTDSGFVTDLVAGIHQNALDSIRTIVESGVDALNCGPGDVGAQRSLLMSPDTWRKYFAELWKEEIDLIHSQGKLVYCHSCGDNTPIIGDYVDLGVDIYDPMQPESMDIYKIKKEYGDRITFRGAIGTQELLYTDPATIRDRVRETVEVMAVGGGYLAAPAKPIPIDVPWNNVVALAETLLEYAGPA